MEKIDVMFTADSKYVDIMLASIYSFLLNSGFKNIRVHIIASDFSLDDCNKIESIINRFSDVELYFYPFQKFNIEKYNIPNWRGGQIANARLFFQDILDPAVLGIDNLLYLDSDTITVANLADLRNYQNGLFAVPNVGLKKLVSARGLDTYFNSGVIFINVNEWAEKNYQDRLIQFLNGNQRQLEFPDQDIFNLVFQEKIKELPISYNLPPCAYLFDDFFGKLYFNPKYRTVGYEEIQQAIRETKIMHTYGILFKAWESDLNPYYDEYMKYILGVNPNFEGVELEGLRKFVSKFPYLYRIMILFKMYFSGNVENIEKMVKSFRLKLKNNK